MESLSRGMNRVRKRARFINGAFREGGCLRHEYDLSLVAFMHLKAWLVVSRTVIIRAVLLISQLLPDR